MIYFLRNFAKSWIENMYEKEKKESKRKKDGVESQNFESKSKK